MSRAIRIWEFDKAPKKYKKLFDPDDTDWLAFIPKEVYEENFYFPFFGGYQWGYDDCEEGKHISDGVVLVYRHS